MTMSSEIQLYFVCVCCDFVFLRFFKIEVQLMFTTLYQFQVYKIGASQVALVLKNLPANAEDVRDSGSIPGS